MEVQEPKLILAAIDFDGTLAKWADFPNIGREVPHAVNVVKKLQEAGIAIILWTCRSGDSLDMAVQWCKDRGIDLYAVNVRPYQTDYSTSPKVHADFYIDDAAIGCPLIRTKYERPFVDWILMDKLLKLRGILK